MKYSQLIIVLHLTLFFSASLFAQEAPDDTTPTLEIGAQVFNQRCVLCHGDQAMGEGRIPLKIKDYPKTTLTVPNKAKTKDEIFGAIVYGGMLPTISEFMPPMGNELTWTEILSVSLFIEKLREDPEAHLALLRKERQPEQAENVNLGINTFKARCVLCHGEYGEGNGRMAKVIKDPPPFNLTKSTVPLEYLKIMVSKGGEAMGRSKQMPPWGDQLSPDEIDAVTQYIMTLRK